MRVNYLSGLSKGEGSTTRVLSDAAESFASKFLIALIQRFLDTEGSRLLSLYWYGLR